MLIIYPINHQGRYSDHTANKWQTLRHGSRIPEDRLRSTIVSIGVLNPLCMLLYGWSVEKEVGGIPLPVIAMFFHGVGQLLGFPALNTYGIDVARGNSAEMVAGSYLIRYLIAAVGSAVCNTAIDRVGIGWFCTLSAGLMMVSAGCVWCVTRWGERWRQGIDQKEMEKEKKGKMEAERDGGKMARRKREEEGHGDGKSMRTESV